MAASPYQRTILIAGPTASGKSRLALRLAEGLGGTIINADSMQVYRELRVLTARPTPEEEARAPHALYGFVPGAEAYSAGRYAADAAQAIAAARREGRIPIIVGGTASTSRPCSTASRRSRRLIPPCVRTGAARLRQGRRRSCTRSLPRATP